jgi:hypothetical protein
VDELQKEIQNKNGRTVVIKLLDSGETIRAERPDGQEIGRIELLYIEDDIGGYYYIKWMYFDLLDASYTRQGIGRAALFFHKETFDLPLVVADDDGHQRDDGSHLTGDAPAFVARMLKEGLVHPASPHI